MDRIIKYFKTDSSGGTYMEDVKPGLDRYFREINIQDAFTHYYGWFDDEDKAEWAEMKRRIDCGDPVYIWSEQALCI